MPKLKTNKTASKRILGVTSHGKVRVRHTSAQHLASHKSSRSRHLASLETVLNTNQSKKLRRLIPYES